MTERSQSFTVLWPIGQNRSHTLHHFFFFPISLDLPGCFSHFAAPLLLLHFARPLLLPTHLPHPASIPTPQSSISFNFSQTFPIIGRNYWIKEVYCRKIQAPTGRRHWRLQQVFRRQCRSKQCQVKVCWVERGRGSSIGAGRCMVGAEWATVLDLRAWLAAGGCVHDRGQRQRRPTP